MGEDVGYRWSSDGSGVFELAEAEGLKVGSKIIIHLNAEAQEFSKEDHVKEIVEKYSNFVSAPIFLNGKKVNVLEPLWLLNSSQVTDEMHDEFYRFISITKRIRPFLLEVSFISLPTSREYLNSPVKRI